MLVDKTYLATDSSRSRPKEIAAVATLCWQTTDRIFAETIHYNTWGQFNPLTHIIVNPAPRQRVREDLC